MREGAAQSARLVVGIETSCDDTSVAFVGDGRVESALVSQTQIEPHLGYGGVVPEAAARIHAEVIDAVFAKALRQAGVGLDTVDGVAVTYGPGLPGALLVGLRFAQGLAFAIQRPLIPVNHLEGHFAAPWLSVDPPPEFPIVALVVSGGHTELLHAAAPGAYRLLGRTRDDAAGEAFDKVARLLGLLVSWWTSDRAGGLTSGLHPLPPAARSLARYPRFQLQRPQDGGSTTRGGPAGPQRSTANRGRPCRQRA